MMTINGEEIATYEQEFGTRYEWDGQVVESPADDRKAAEELATMTGGTVIKRTVYFSPWQNS